MGIQQHFRLIKKNDLTLGQNINEDATYPIGLSSNHPLLISKCKTLRRLIAKNKTGPIKAMQGNFLEMVGEKKYSKIVRILSSQKVNQSLPGPPSYFTRRREGYPLPPLEEFMRGYQNIMSLDIPSKTKETAFLIMNRQIWTSKKGSLVNANRGIEGGRGECSLCAQIENTQHLLMECEAYSSKIWEILSKTINELKIHKGHAQLKLHTYNVMYHIPPTQ